uniref:Uncharacterized protein n=1 Tax=Oryctolagus cuniculus TaxID=9986 RepID=A0A5F9DD83_RABIT
MGRQAIIHTIIVGKMEIVLPAMYMMKRFIGICFRGPKAISQIRSVSCTLVSGTCLSK